MTNVTGKPALAEGSRVCRVKWNLGPAALSVTVLTFLSGCGVVGSGSDGVELAEFTVTSPAFADQKDIPARYACPELGGQGNYLPLHWSGMPDAKAFAVIVDDPDARNGTYIHWVLANLDRTTADLVEGALPETVVIGRNSAKQTDYKAPCPPKGQRHRYRFTVYALKEPVPATKVGELKDSLPAIASRTIGSGRITGYLGQPSPS